MLADAHGYALHRSAPGEAGSATVAPTIGEADIDKVVRSGRLVQHTPVRARRTREVGKTLGLAVSHHVGSLLEIEAIAFAATETRKGSVRFNETAGSMARDSVFNAGSVVRAIAGLDPLDFDLHVNVIGGANVDGPSAGLAIFVALYSAMTQTPLPQDVAMTGELSIAGKIRAVGGVVEKVYAARAAEMRLVLIPKENEKDAVAVAGGVQIVPVANVAEAFAALGVTVKRARALSAARAASARTRAVRGSR
jgi:ATP-dependent Lon protease